MANSCSPSKRSNLCGAVALGAAMLTLATGCGTTQSSLATEQLLLSDAVDRSVAGIDFRPLTGTNVFLDTEYVITVKDRGFVNAPYVISSIRQQLLAADCRLVEKKEDAEFIVEPRIGTMASDAHRMIIGIPAANNLNTATELVPNAPRLPSIPELALARRETQDAAAKIAVFAYHRVTREPVWQSGLSLAQSTARDTWVFGIGPFHRSAVRDGNRLVGNEFKFGGHASAVAGASKPSRPEVDYDVPMVFNEGWPASISRPQMASAEPEESSPLTEPAAERSAIMQATNLEPVAAKRTAKKNETEKPASEKKSREKEAVESAAPVPTQAEKPSSRPPAESSRPTRLPAVSSAP